MEEPQGSHRKPLLQMENASLSFGNEAGVFDMSFSLEPASILGMIGPSGCGKTTTVRLLTGIYEPDSGSVQVFDRNPSAFTDSDKARIGYVPQHFILYPHLSTEENLNFMGGMYGLLPARKRSRITELLDFFELTDARSRLVRHLSGGMQRRLMLAGALLHDPELIFADEPTGGIDPILRARIWDYFRALRDEGRTLMFTTQYVGEAAFCDRVAVMRKGRLVTVDTPEGLRRQAMGGDVIHLKVEPANIFQVMQYANELPQVRKVEQVEGEQDEIFVFVEDAGKQLPALLAMIRADLDITPRNAEPYLPPFDEVFLRLVQYGEASE